MVLGIKCVSMVMACVCVVGTIDGYPPAVLVRRMFFYIIEDGMSAGGESGVNSVTSCPSRQQDPPTPTAIPDGLSLPPIYTAIHAARGHNSAATVSRSLPHSLQRAFRVTGPSGSIVHC